MTWLYTLVYKNVVYVWNGVIHLYTHKKNFIVYTVITHEKSLSYPCCIMMVNIHTIEFMCTCMCYNIPCSSWNYFIHSFQAEVKLEYLLNLSILISKGKEINWDCLSNGEWTGKSSLLKRVGFTSDMHCSIWGNFCRMPVRVSSFDQGFYHRRC